MATLLAPRNFARLVNRPGTMFVPIVAVVFALLAVCRSATAAEPGLRRGARPAWVSPAGIDFSAPAAAPGAVQNGRQYLLWDRQVRLDGGHSESYSRWVLRITNESGLQEAAQVNLGFDPASENLTLHSVVIHRDGKTLDRLDFDAIKVAQRERELERQVYDGRKSAVLFVSDLRVGDVLDYDFTLRGADPTLGGRYEGVFGLGGAEPVEHLHARLVAPRAAPIHVTLHAYDPANRVTAEEADVASTHEYLWDLHGVPAYPAEDDTPSWVDAAPWAQVSQFESWGEVAEWGATLFARRDAGPAVHAWVLDAGKDARRPDEFTLRALRFVQDEIRYVGVEVGIGRRKPADPEAVLARRYGDCKDKVALLTAGEWRRVPPS